MNDFRPTDLYESLSDRPVSNPTSEPPAAGRACTTASPPPSSPPDGTVSAPTAQTARRSGMLRLWANRRRRWIAAAAALTCAVIGLSVGIARSGSSTATPPAAAIASSSSGGSSGSAPTARSGPAAGGASGTVASVSSSGFTMTTSAGQNVTVDEASSTTYQNGTYPTSPNAIITGESVLVLGTTNGTTITATNVTVQPTEGGSAASLAAGVIPFQRGAPTTSKQVGQTPANYRQGSGTIVSGTTANMATKAALAAYPGGVVDRVVQLGNGEYEVHYIGVNWPHHIFVNQDFMVIGAN